MATAAAMGLRASLAPRRARVCGRQRGRFAGRRLCAAAAAAAPGDVLVQVPERVANEVAQVAGTFVVVGKEVPTPDLDQATVDALSYATIALVALSFAGTFFVLPFFADNLKEKDGDWKEIYAKLVQRGVKTIDSAKAASMQKRGAVVLDVRMAAAYERGAIEGSVSAPLYRPIQGWDPASVARRAAFAFFGINNSERMPDWDQVVAGSVKGKGQDIIVCCEMGGNLTAKKGAMYGFQSRSLKAVHFLQELGYKKVFHLDGGVPQAVRDGLPTTRD